MHYNTVPEILPSVQLHGTWPPMKLGSLHNRHRHREAIHFRHNCRHCTKAGQPVAMVTMATMAVATRTYQCSTCTIKGRHLQTRVHQWSMHRPQLWYKVLSRLHNPQECATACTTSIQCCDGRTSYHVTLFNRLHRQTVQSDYKRFKPAEAGLRTTLYLSCTGCKLCVRVHHVM